MPSAPRAIQRALLAELIGTFALTLVAAGGDVIAALDSSTASHASRAVAPGLIVLALIYAIGNDSGAHYNPAVTFAFALRKAFPWRWVPSYWGAQLVGAGLAAALLRVLFGAIASSSVNHPHYGSVAALIMEIALSLLLVLIILGTATRYSLIGTDAALAVGATIACAGLFASPVSGASMNPARSLGPALVNGSLGDAWIYVLGPGLGATLAVGITATLHRQHHRGEQEAAQGEHLEHAQESQRKQDTDNARQP
jgi:aquaporin Z